MNAIELSPVVRGYLGELEIELKQVPGIAPEDVLADVRDRILESWPGGSREDLVRAVGSPADLARTYAPAEPILQERLGFAPGWRICCSRCGRSTPLDRLRAVRMSARSSHKYTVGRCTVCGGLRWLHILNDLEEANLTARLGAERTPAEIRREMHRPWTVVLTILGAVAAAVLLTGLIVGTVLMQLAR